MRVDFDPQSMARNDVYRPLTATVLSRPIAWASMVSTDGAANLGPARFCGKR